MLCGCYLNPKKITTCNILWENTNILARSTIARFLTYADRHDLIKKLIETTLHQCFFKVIFGLPPIEIAYSEVTSHFIASLFIYPFHRVVSFLPSLLQKFKMVAGFRTETHIVKRLSIIFRTKKKRKLDKMHMKCTRNMIDKKMFPFTPSTLTSDSVI